MQEAPPLTRTDVRTGQALSSKKELGLPVGEPPVQLRPKTGLQVLCFLRVPASVRADGRTKAALSSKKELIQVEVQAMQKDRVALLPAKQVVYRLTAVFLGTAYFARETS